MSRRGFSSIATLVEDLLARHERNPEARGLIAAIDDDGFANMDLRDAFDEALSDLERDGGVELIRKGPKTDRRVTGARLKSPEVLYRFVGREPAARVALQSVASLRSRPDLPHGAVDLIDVVAAAWGRGVSHIGVGRGEAPFPSMPYVGIPAEVVEGLRLGSRPDYVLTIENFTSFVRHAREIARSEKALIIYSGGFPSRPALATIHRLAEQARAPTYHWGDMDGGGVRIFRHIERELAERGVQLQPHMMDAQLLAAVGRPSDGAPSALGDMAGSAIAELAEALRTTGFVHEQEELDPRRPVIGEPPNDQNARDRLAYAVRSGQVGVWSTATEKAERLLLGIENRALSVRHGSILKRYSGGHHGPRRRVMGLSEFDPAARERVSWNIHRLGAQPQKRPLFYRAPTGTIGEA